MIAVPAAQATPPPTSSVPRSPIAGIRTNPASSEPRIAPVVLTAYQPSRRRCGRRPARHTKRQAQREDGTQGDGRRQQQRRRQCGLRHDQRHESAVGERDPPADKERQLVDREQCGRGANPNHGKAPGQPGSGGSSEHSRTPSDAPIAMPPMNATSMVPERINRRTEHHGKDAGPSHLAEERDEP